MESTWSTLQTNQRRLVKRSTGRRSSKMADLPFEWVFCSFVWFCYVNAKVSPTAAGRNSLSSLSECESLSTQDTILFLLLWKCCFTSTRTVGLLGTASRDVHLDFHTAPELWNFISLGRSLFKWPSGVNIQAVKRQAKGRALCGIITWCATRECNALPTAGYHNHGLQSLLAVAKARS